MQYAQSYFVIHIEYFTASSVYFVTTVTHPAAFCKVLLIAFRLGVFVLLFATFPALSPVAIYYS